MPNALAIAAWNFLANGMGGVDWQHLHLAADFYGISDLEALVEAIVLIKTHRAAADRSDETEAA